MLKLRKMAPVHVAEVGQHGDAFVVLFQHGEEDGLGLSDLATKHELLRLVEPAELVVGEPVDVVKGVLRHACWTPDPNMKFLTPRF